MSDNISAVYIQGSSYENELNVLLVPPNEIRGDVRSLAGNLNFTMHEVNYIMKKNYPFVYMLDAWIKRVGAEDATLQCLQRELDELERPDAVEIITNAIGDLESKNPKDLQTITKRYNSKLKRSESNASLCPNFHVKSAVVEDIPLGQRVDISKEKKLSVEKLFKNSKNSSKTSSNKKSEKKDVDDAPTAYIVYVTEDEEHLKSIQKLVQKLRTKYGISVKSEMFESNEYAESQGYYIYSNLIDAEYVIFICTPSFAVKNEDSEESRKVTFIQKLVLDFMFENSTYKSKYIPILLPGCKRKDVPFFLSGSTVYDMLQKEFYDDVYRRICKQEKYVLGELPEKRPQLKPINISDMFRSSSDRVK